MIASFLIHRSTIQVISVSGSAGSLVTFSGGWNRTDMSTEVAGEQTWFDGQNGDGTGLLVSTMSFVALNGIYFSRYNSGLYVATPCTGLTSTLIVANNCTSAGIFFDGISNDDQIDNLLLACCQGTSGASLETEVGGGRLRIGTARILGGTATGITLCSPVRIGSLTTQSCSTYGLRLSKPGTAVIDTFSSGNNGTAAISMYSRPYNLMMRNATIPETIECAVDALNIGMNCRAISENHEAAGAHRIWTDGGIIQSCADANRHTLSGICWQLCPTASSRSATYPLDFVLVTVAVNAGALVTVTAYLMRDNAGLTGRLVCRGGQIAGVATDVYDQVTTTGTYEQQTITFTPSEAGVVQIEAWAYGGTTYSLYVDDLTITQA
jgi:hypothetical protein